MKTKNDIELNQLAYETLMGLKHAQNGESIFKDARRESFHDCPTDAHRHMNYGFAEYAPMFEGWVSVIEQALRQARDSR